MRGPSCHQKKVQLFGALLTESILYPVPHRHFTLDIPKMLRPYFRYDRNLLKDLCRIAHECLAEYMRTTLVLVGKDLLPPARARMLRGWVHSGFNVYRSRRVLPTEREDLQRLAQYIMRNPFSLENMQFNEPDDADFHLTAQLRHLGLWDQGVRVLPARAPPEIEDRVIEPCFDDPFPDYDTEPVMMYANG